MLFITGLNGTDHYGYGPGYGYYGPGYVVYTGSRVYRGFPLLGRRCAQRVGREGPPNPILTVQVQYRGDLVAVTKRHTMGAVADFNTSDGFSLDGATMRFATVQRQRCLDRGIARGRAGSSAFFVAIGLVAFAVPLTLTNAA